MDARLSAPDPGCCRGRLGRRHGRGARLDRVRLLDAPPDRRGVPSPGALAHPARGPRARRAVSRRRVLPCDLPDVPRSVPPDPRGAATRTERVAVGGTGGWGTRLLVLDRGTGRAAVRRRSLARTAPR